MCNDASQDVYENVIRYYDTSWLIYLQSPENLIIYDRQVKSFIHNLSMQQYRTYNKSLCHTKNK